MNDQRNIDRRDVGERRVAKKDRRGTNERGSLIHEEKRHGINRRAAIRRLFHRREGWISI